jgi:tetratricopeptide (TPR) repeat protein
VRLDPRNGDAMYLLGQSLQSQGKRDEAVHAWKQTLALDPGHKQALYSLFRALAKTDSQQAAQYRARFEALQEQNGITERARTLSNFALAAAQSGKWDQAIGQLREAIQVCGVCSSLGTLHKNLGLTECEAGRLEDGEKELRLALKEAPGDPEILKPLQVLENLRANSAR